MRPVATDTDTERAWIRVAATRDPDTADRWRAAVEAAGIAVEAHIEDPRDALPGTAGMPDLVLGSGFAYGIWVAPEDRVAAGRALIDAGWDGRHGSRNVETPAPRTLLRGALLAIAAALVIVILRSALQ